MLEVVVVNTRDTAFFLKSHQRIEATALGGFTESDLGPDLRVPDRHRGPVFPGRAPTQQPLVEVIGDAPRFLTGLAVMIDRSAHMGAQNFGVMVTVEADRLRPLGGYTFDLVCVGPPVVATFDVGVELAGNDDAGGASGFHLKPRVIPELRRGQRPELEAVGMPVTQLAFSYIAWRRRRGRPVVLAHDGTRQGHPYVWDVGLIPGADGADVSGRTRSPGGEKVRDRGPISGNRRHHDRFRSLVLRAFVRIVMRIGTSRCTPEDGFNSVGPKTT